jgi:hypothetical protein
MKGLRGPVDGQPSWVIDWVHYWSGPKTFQESKIYSWKTTYPNVPLLNNLDPMLLSTRGCVMGTICALSSAICLDADGKQLESQCYEPKENEEWMTAWSNELQKNYPSGVAIAIWQSLNQQYYNNDLFSNIDYTTNSDAYRMCYETFWKPKGREAVSNLNLTQLKRWMDEKCIFENRVANFARMATDPLQIN